MFTLILTAPAGIKYGSVITSLDEYQRTHTHVRALEAEQQIRPHADAS